MTTLFSERDPPATPEPPSVLKEATSYLYLVYWTYWYVFRLRVLGKLLRRSLGLLIVVELLGSASHAFTWEAQSLWVRLVLAFTLVAVASTLVYHHHRLQIRVERHSILLTSIMVLLDSETGSGVDAVAILDTFTFALRFHRKGSINASIVFRKTREEPFTILAQDRDNAFSSMTRLHPTDSVAGNIAQAEPGTIIYVPATKYVHAVQFASTTSVGMTGVPFRTTKIVPSAFQQADSFYDPQIMRALLCIRIPVTGQRSSGCAVLSLSSSRRDAFGDLDFHALKVAGALIAVALRD